MAQLTDKELQDLFNKILTELTKEEKEVLDRIQAEIMAAVQKHLQKKEEPPRTPPAPKS